MEMTFEEKWNENILLRESILEAWKAWYYKDGWMFCGNSKSNKAADMAFHAAYKAGYRHGKESK